MVEVPECPEVIEVCSKSQRELADKITQHAPIDEIRILLACGAKINDSVTQGLKPLHYAVYGNNLDVVKLLLVRGSNINAVDDVGYSAMHLCAEHGNYGLIEYLIEHDAQVCFVDRDEKEEFPVGFKCEEPLRMAIKNGHYECAELLLQNGADPNARYFQGSELTMIGVIDTEFLALLLLYGANPNVYNRDGLTPLMKAAKHPLGLEAVTLLLEYGANINAIALERQDFRTPLHYAILSGNLDVVVYLVERGAVVNMPPEYDKPTPLDVAVIRDSLEIVEYLLAKGADPKIHHTYIGTPLHLACCSVLENQYEIIECLLKNGADPNSCPVFESGPIRSPLIEYFRAGRPTFDPKITQLLLAYGAEVVMQGPLRNPQGILRAITRLKEKDFATWDLLLDAGVNYDRKYIDRLSLPTKFKLDLAVTADNPPSLKQRARAAIRTSIQPMRPEKMMGLDVPRTLRAYLSFGFCGCEDGF